MKKQLDEKYDREDISLKEESLKWIPGTKSQDNIHFEK